MQNTQKIVEYARRLSFADLPPAAVEAAKTTLLDTCGALFAAWPDRHPAPRILSDYVKDLGGPPECTVLGRDFKAPAPNAVLINGLMGYAGDIEGGILARPPVHAAALTVPTSLAMCERQRASGKDLIVAMVLSYDVIDRVSKANFTPQSYPHSFHPSAIFGTFGAVAIAGSLLGLDEEQFTNAFGLAGNIAGGLIAWIYDPTEHSRPFGIGLGAHNGVMAALLAAKGFGGPQRVFDGTQYNIFDAYSGAMDLSYITQDLGEDFAITRHDGFKKYPCCNDIHTGLDALLKIMKDNELQHEQIASITHKVKEHRRPVIDNNPLKSHNAQYILSVAAVEGRLRWDDFLNDRRTEPTIGAIYGRTRLVGAPELANSPNQEPAIVEVTTLDGRCFSEHVEVARGHMLNPLSRSELEAKFLGWAKEVVGVERGHEIIAAIDSLETLGDVNELMDLIAR